MRAKPEIQTQKIGNTNMRYLHYPGNGPAVIMLHATGFFPWLWHPIAGNLAGKYRVIVPSLNEHRSINSEGMISWLMLAEDICNLCGKLNVNKPFMIGHSMGGTVITLAEALFGPLARKILLVEPIYLPRWTYKEKATTKQHPMASMAIRRRNYWNDAHEARDYLCSKTLFKEWDAEMLDIYIRHGMVSAENGGLTLACSPQTEAALFLGSSSKDPWPLLQEVHCPVLILEGEESVNREYIDLNKAASLFPGGKYRLIEGAGHLIPMEQPRTIEAVCREYFN